MIFVVFVGFHVFSRYIVKFRNGICLEFSKLSDFLDDVASGSSPSDSYGYSSTIPKIWLPMYLKVRFNVRVGGGRPWA